MTITGIKTNVQAILTASNYFITVLPAPPEQASDFEGFPSVSHYYVNTDSNYATVSQNRRVIEYRIELYLITDKGTDAKTQYAEAYALVDNVIQLLDESIDLSSQTLGLSRACDIMRPTPGALTPISTDRGEGLQMTINLFCESDVSFR